MPFATGESEGRAALIEACFAGWDSPIHQQKAELVSWDDLVFVVYYRLL